VKVDAVTRLESKPAGVDDVDARYVQGSEKDDCVTEWGLVGK